MTILFFSRLFYPHIGGVEKHVLEVGKRLVRKGYRVIVITEEISTSENKTSRLGGCQTVPPRSKNNIPVYQSRSSSAKLTGRFEGIEVYRIPVGKDDWFKKFRIWRELWKYKDLIKKADIVHCHDVFFWYLPFRFINFNKPIYTTFHGYETKFPPSKKAILIRKISEKLSWGNICVGDYIGKWYETTATSVTYGGVEIVNPPHPNPLPTRREREMGEGESSKLKILFIGRLEEDTGVLIYLKALEILKEKKINFDFEACGDGSLSGMVEQYGRVHGFAGDLGLYLRQADVVFASSYLSILEAMKQKKLVFAVYDNRLKEDYLKMSPFAKWIVIENSPEKLAGKIKYFIQHQEEREKLVNKSDEWVKKQTWEKVVGIYLKLWESTSEESIRPPPRCYEAMYRTVLGEVTPRRCCY